MDDSTQVTSAQPQDVIQTQDQGSNFTPFSDIAQDQSQGQSVFPDPKTEVAQSPYTEKGTQNQAVLSALAMSPNQSSDETFNSVVAQQKELINKGQQPIVRDNLATTRQQQEQNISTAVQKDFVQNPTKYPEGTNVIDLINHQYNLSQQQPDQDTLEDQATTQMQNVGASDTAQAAIMSSVLAKGDGLQIVHDHGVKIQLLGREFDKMSAQYQSEGVLDKATDFLGSFLPGRAELTGIGVTGDNGPNGGVKGRLSALANPGEALQTEVDTLLNLPLPEFKKQLPQVIQRIRDNATIIPGMPNLSVAREALSHYVGGVSDDEKINYNIWAGTDVAGILPVGKLVGLAKSPSKMLNMMGSRSVAAEMAAQDLMKGAQGIDPSAGPLGPVLGDTAAVEESLPSSVVPKTADLVRPYVGTSSDIADRLDNISAAIKNVSLNPVDRLSPSQFGDAVQDAIKDAELKFKDDNIVDFDRPEQLAPGEVNLKGYHGTSSAFTDYDTSLAGSATSAVDAKTSGATFFSSDPDVASGYADFASRDAHVTGAGPNVRPAKINLKNPKVIDWNGEMYSLTKFKKLIPEAKAAGHDGVIIKNVNDSVKDGPRNSDVYAVFKPNESTSPVFGGAVKGKKAGGVPETDLVGGNGQLKSPKQGVAETVTLHRGAKKGSTGNFYSNDRKIAEMYAGKTGIVTSGEHKFSNLLKTDNWMTAKRELGMTDDTSMPDMLKRAEQYGYDGVSFKTTNGQEYVKLNPIQSIPELDLIGGPYVPPSASVPEHDFRPITTLPRFGVSRTDSGTANLSFYLGRKSGGGGYVSRLAASNGATRRGFSLADVEIHQNVDGQYFIKVTQPVSETGVAQPVLQGKDFHASQLTGWLKSPTSSLPDDWGRALLNSNMNRTLIQKKVVNPLAKAINGTRDKETLKAVIGVTQQNKEWLNLSDLAQNWERIGGKQITDKDVISYYSYKELNDFNWSVFNRDAYVTRARRGMQTVTAADPNGSFDTGRVNGYNIDTPDFQNTRVFDLEDRMGYKEGTNNKKLQEKWDTGSYRLLQLEQPHLYNKEPHKFILVKKGDSSVGPLEHQQVGYVAGGSREYPSKYFVKQAVHAKFNDGTSYVLDDQTHITAHTRSQAKAWADKMEAARQAWNNDTLDPIMKQEIIERSPVENIEKWEQMVNSGDIRTDTPFEVVFDKERTQAGRPAGATDWQNYEMGPNDQYFQSKKRMYYSQKGDQLRDPSGDYAEILDPMTTLGRATTNAARTMALSDYSRKVIDEWSRVALPFIDKSSVGGNLTPDSIFFKGKLRGDTDPTMLQKLEAARSIHNRFLSLKTPTQKWLDWNTRKLADWVDGDNKVQQWAAQKVLNNMSSNPVDAVNGFVFDTLFGAFNPAQLIVQTQTAAAAIIANPRWGIQAAAAYPAIKMALINTSDNLLDHLSKAGQFIHGLDPAEWRMMVKTMRDNGWMEVGGNVVQLDQYNNRLGGSLMSRSVAGAREAGRWPFYEAERINRAVAYQIAWKEVKETAKDLAVGSQDFKDRVLQRADDWAMNMTTASQSAWQKGAWNIPTKYLGYQMKFLENALGGNKRFTPAMRAKLVTSQFLMYGTAGIPTADVVFNYVNESMQKNTNQPMDPETYRAWSKGGWDSLMYELSGGQLDTDFAYRAGQGAAWSQLYSKLAEGKMSSVFDVVTGPSWEISGNAYNNFMQAISYFKAEQSTIPSAQTFSLFANDLAKTLATYRYATKAYTIWKLGYLKDPKTGEAIAPADKLEALATGLGIPLRGETERWDMYNRIADQEQVAQDVGKHMADLRRKAFQAISDGDVKAQEGFNNQAAATMAPYRDEPLLQQQIVQQANKNLGYTIDDWTSMANKFNRVTGMPAPGGPLHGGQQ